MNELISAGRHEIRTADNEEWIRGNVYFGHSSNVLCVVSVYQLRQSSHMLQIKEKSICQYL